MTELPEVFMDHAQPELLGTTAHLITALELDSVIKRLRGLSTGSIPCSTDVGVCGNIDPILRWGEGYALVEMCSPKYPGFSGDTAFPLLGGLVDYAGDHWSGRQGAERRRFCAWLADYLERFWVPAFEMAKCDWED